MGVSGKVEYFKNKRPVWSLAPGDPTIQYHWGNQAEKSGFKVWFSDSGSLTALSKLVPPQEHLSF